MPLLLLAQGKEVRVGHTAERVAAVLGREAETGAQRPDSGPLGERITRFYDFSGTRFALVFESPRGRRAESDRDLHSVEPTTHRTTSTRRRIVAVDLGSTAAAGRAAARVSRRLRSVIADEDVLARPPDRRSWS